MNARKFLRPVLIASLIAALGGCATTGPGQNVFYGTGKSFRMNGVLISELQPDTFGKGVSRLTVKSAADAQALEGLAQFFAGQAAKAAANGDAELFGVAWHLGKQVTKARLEQIASAEAFANALAASKNGKATLPGGGRVFLPTALTEPAPAKASKKRAALDGISDSFLTFGVQEINWGLAPKVAAVGDSIRGVLSALPGALAGGESRLDVTALGSMNVGSAYAVRDSLGNKYIVEKVQDGIVLHNPDSTPVKVDLNQINFMPILDKPEAYRYEAARIVANINAQFEQAYREEATARAISIGGHFSIAPNGIRLGDKTGYLNADGTFAAGDSPTSRRLYSTNRAYKLAIDLTTDENLQRDPNFQSFRRNCSNRTFRIRHGEALEYATYSCRDEKNNISYSRTMLVGASFTAQSWDSVLADNRYLDQLKDNHRRAKIAEAVAAFMPGLGNIDAASRCTDGPALSYYIAQASLRDTVNADVRRFVNHVPEKETASTLDKALDCAQAIGGLSAPRRALSAGARAMKLESILASAEYQRTTELMGLLDTKMYGATTFDELTAVTSRFSSPTAAFVTKVFYDQVQHANNISGLLSAMYERIAG